MRGPSPTEGAAPAPPASHACPTCGAPIPLDAPEGFCLNCLLREGVAHIERRGTLATHPVDRLGDYEILGELGRGGMGRVYRARQVSLDRTVALKVIANGGLAAPRAIERFQTEAAAAASLDHPHIVPIFEVGEYEGCSFFSMRLIEGSTLGHELEHGPLAFESAARVLATVARAIQHAHERGVLHRDLKPANILLDNAGQPHVSDFGLAKITHRESDLTLTQMALGTPAYMSPEQAAGRNHDVTTATDIYSLGAVLFEMLTGCPPFSGNSALAIARQVIDREPQQPSALNRAVPNDLAVICLKCLEKDPARRYPTAGALAEDLERWLRHEPISARPAAPWDHFIKWVRRRPAVATLLGLSVVLLMVGVIGIAWQWRQAEQARAAQGRSLHEARRAQAESAAALARLRWDQVGRWIEAGETSHALAFLAARIRERPDLWQATMYAMSILDQHAFPISVGPTIQTPRAPKIPTVLSGDGRWFAAADTERKVYVWDPLNGREIARFERPGSITALATSADPARLAIADDSGALVVLNPANTNSPSAELKPESCLRSLQFSGDGARLMGVSEQAVEVWNLAQPKPESLVLRLTEGVRGARLSVRGDQVLAWNPQTAAFWDLAHPTAPHRFTAEQTFVNGALAASQSRAALIDGEFTARLWDTSTGRALNSLHSTDFAWDSIALDADGSRLIAAGHQAYVSFLDTTSGQPFTTSVRHHYNEVRLVPSADGSSFATSARDSVVRVWNAKDGRALMAPIWHRFTAEPAQIQLSADGRLLLVELPGEDKSTKSLTLWSRTRPRPQLRYQIPGERGLDSSRISPNGRLGTMGYGKAPHFKVFDLDTGQTRLEAAAIGSAYAMLFSPDHERVYGLTANGGLQGWSLATGQALWPANRQSGLIRPAAISPDGRWILAGHNDGHVRIYDAATGQLVRSLEHPGEVKVLWFAPQDSQRFLSGSTDNLAHIWDLTTGQRLTTFTGHEGPIISGAWSPDARYVATASYDTTVRLWEAASGRPIGVPMHHLAWLAQVSFSPDGQFLLTGCRDGTARVWRVPTGTPVCPPLQQGHAIRTVRFVHDGSAFLVRDLEGFRFWDMENFSPVTVHYPATTSGGIGMDSESYRAIITPEGRRFFDATGMNSGVYYDIEQPRGSAPDWFADFLESLALMRLDQQGSPRVLASLDPKAVFQRIRSAPADDHLAHWARQRLGFEPEAGVKTNPPTGAATASTKP